MKATDHLNKANEIGSGGYGNVYIAKNLRSIGTIAAVKVLTKVIRLFFIHVNIANYPYILGRIRCNC